MRCATLLALSLAACSGARAPSPAAPAPPAAIDAGAPAVTDVPAAPVDPAAEAALAAWRRAHPQPAGSARIIAGPVDCDDDGAQGARVAAVVMDDSSAALVVTRVPFVEGAAAIEDYVVSGDVAGTVAGISARDLNGDGRRDIAVFLRREDEVEGYAPLQRYARLYALRTEPEWALAAMHRAEAELLGVRDDDALAAAIPTLGRFEPPAEGMSPARFIARLRYATPAQFRQVVAPSGLRLCTDFPDRSEVRRKRCVTHPVARLTDALITGRIRRDLGQFMEFHRDDASGLTTPSCARQGRELRCGANVGGPAGTNWALVGEGAAMRIVEISPWAESS